MNHTIDQAIQQALEAMKTHSDHWLLPIQRRALYAVLDPDLSLPRAAHVRSWLELFTAEYVLPLWMPILQDPVRVWIEDEHVPALMVDLTRSVLNGGTEKIAVQNLAPLWQEISVFDTDESGEVLVERLAVHWTEVSDLTGELTNSRYYRAWCVYDAALTALNYALGVDYFAYARLNYTTTEITDRYSDAANWAVISYSDGVWEPDYTQDEEYGRVVGNWNLDRDEVRAKRRQFWEWWLLEAISDAREHAHGHS